MMYYCISIAAKNRGIGGIIVEDVLFLRNQRPKRGAAYFSS
jgi:hypothetical protein